MYIFTMFIKYKNRECVIILLFLFQYFIIFMVINFVYLKKILQRYVCNFTPVYTYICH